VRKLVHRLCIPLRRDEYYSKRSETVIVRYYERLRARDRQGNVLWEVSIGGTFHVIERLKVVKVIDESSVWTNRKLGWEHVILSSKVSQGYSIGKILYTVLLRSTSRKLQITASVVVSKNLSKYGNLIIVSL